LLTIRILYREGWHSVFIQGKEWKPMKLHLLPTGYKQITLSRFSRKGDGFIVRLYIHQLVYLLYNGTYNPDYQIDHVDNDLNNNDFSNLRAVTRKINLDNRPRRKANKQGIKTIRSSEIKEIRALYNQGLTQYAIAKLLDLNRLSVRYIVKRIEQGLPLKYE
jgi:hypothetical protein